MRSLQREEETAEYSKKYVTSLTCKTFLFCSDSPSWCVSVWDVYAPFLDPCVVCRSQEEEI